MLALVLVAGHHTSAGGAAMKHMRGTTAARSTRSRFRSLRCCWLFVLVSLTAIGCGGFTTPPPEGAAEGAAEEPAPEILGDCRDGMRLSAGEGCRYSGGGRHRAEVVLSVSRDGLICREGGPAQHQDLPEDLGILQDLGITFDNLRICRDDAFVRDDTFESSILVERGRDGSWAFYSSAAAWQTAQPSDPVDLREDSAPCTAGLLLHPGDECSTGGFTMSIREDGAAVLDGNIGGISMGNTVMNAQSINLNRFNATRSGSTWTIERLPGTSSHPITVPTMPTIPPITVPTMPTIPPITVPTMPTTTIPPITVPTMPTIPPITGASSASPQLEDCPEIDLGTITSSVIRSGMWGPGDCVLDDDTYVDLYVFRIDQQSKVLIDLSSDDADSYLILIASEDTHEDDDGGEGRNARLTETLTSGTFGLLANTFGTETGSYMLRISIGSG